MHSFIYILFNYIYISQNDFHKSCRVSLNSSPSWGVSAPLGATGAVGRWPQPMIRAIQADPMEQIRQKGVEKKTNEPNKGYTVLYSYRWDSWYTLYTEITLIEDDRGESRWAHVGAIPEA